MILNLKRCISLLLVLMLLIGIVPTAFAAEVTPDSTVPEETTSHTEEATTATGDEINPTEPTEPTDPPEDSADPTILSEETAVDAPAMMSAADDYGIMTIASTQSGIMLFDFTDNGDYTTRLNSQIAVEYRPNGTDSPKTAYHKNMGWHFARYNNVPYPDDPLYCIEPYRGFAASTSGNSVDRGVTLNGSGSTSGTNVWYALPAARREAIGLILLYSNEMWDHSISVTTTKKDSNPNVPLRIATQFLIFEIVCGLRDPEAGQEGLANQSAYEQPSFTLADYGLESEVFGVIAIPRLEIEMPLYLGASKQNMANGAAIMGQTSLPISGSNTNCVIAGHRGWNGAAYFLYINQLEKGDTVTITNLWETLTYEVVDTDIIYPSNVEAIHIQPDRELLTLLTCHPPASGGKQRYLVFCERVTTEMEDS